MWLRLQISIGCSIVESYEIEIEDEITLDATIVPNCNNEGGSIEIIVTPNSSSSPFNFEWSNGEQSNVITGLEQGIYCLTVSNDYGCIKESCYEINEGFLEVEVESVTNAANPNIDNGAIDLFILSNSNVTVNWSNGAISDHLQNLAAGDYGVTITNEIGCLEYRAITVGLLC